MQKKRAWHTDHMESWKHHPEDHSHTRSYDFWIVRVVAIGPRCDRSAMFATISSSGRILRSIFTRGRAITNDWRISMARTIVGNRATSGSDQRPIYDHSWRPATDGTINRSLHLATDRTSKRGILSPSVRSIVAPEDRWYDKSWGATIDRTINRNIVQPIVRSIVATYDRSNVAPNDLESQVTRFEHDHRPCYDWFYPCDHPRPLRPVVRPLRQVVRSFYDLPTTPTVFSHR